MSTLPRPCIYWDNDLVPHPAVILDVLLSATAPAHLIAKIFAGPAGEREVFDAPWCDPAAPVAGCWSDIP